MTNLKRIAMIGAMVLAIGVTSVTAFATSTYNTPAELVAGLTGKTVESINEEMKPVRKTYGSIANEAGKLDEFKAEMLKMKKEILTQQVTDGKITQERADEIIAAMEANQATCDGTGNARMGQKMGACFGGMMGNGKGMGGRGQGMGGRGQGMMQGKGQRGPGRGQAVQGETTNP